MGKVDRTTIKNWKKGKEGGNHAIFLSQGERGGGGGGEKGPTDEPGVEKGKGGRRRKRGGEAYPLTPTRKGERCSLLTVLPLGEKRKRNGTRGCLLGGEGEVGGCNFYNHSSREGKRKKKEEKKESASSEQGGRRRDICYQVY